MTWRAYCSSVVFDDKECKGKAPVALLSAIGKAWGEAVWRLELKPTWLQRLPGLVRINHLLVQPLRELLLDALSLHMCCMLEPQS